MPQQDQITHSFVIISVITQSVSMTMKCLLMEKP